jgi:hypothetical protein
MPQAEFRIGCLRIKVWRLLKGGLCPLNVVGRNWTVLPQLRSLGDDANPSSGVDYSPSGVGRRLLSLLLKVVNGKMTI